MVKSHNDVSALKGAVAVSLDDSPGLLVQTGPTLLYSMHFANTVAGVSYIQLFNAAALSNVTLGTTTPTVSIPVNTSGVLNMDLSKPLNFPLGLCAFSTTTATGSSAAIQHGTFFYA